MNDETRRRYQALQSLNDQNWAEFQEKTRLEWRLSFGLWTSIVTVIGSIFAGRATNIDLNILKWPAVCLATSLAAFLCVALIGLHIWFLLWIQKRLNDIRANLRTVRSEMWELLKLGKPISTRSKWVQPSFFVQLGITCLLVIVLMSLIFSTSLS